MPKRAYHSRDKVVAQQMLNFEIECSKVLKSDVFSIAPSFRWPNNRESLCGTEIWIWSEISFLRVDTINLMSARNGKVGRIYFLIVMPCTVRWGSIFSWLWLSPVAHLTGHMGGAVQAEDGTGPELVMVVAIGCQAHGTVTVGGVGPSPGKATCLSGDHLGNLCKEEALPVLYSENPKSYTLCAGNCSFGMS